MQQIFTSRNLTVSYLVGQIDIGFLGLTELQRPFI